MNITEMLHNMCHETLSNADVTAICKARGFSARESATRALFENFFLSETDCRSYAPNLKHTFREIVCSRITSPMLK
jgi:hypothetical protein